MPCPNHPFSHSQPEYELSILNLIIWHEPINVSNFLIWFLKDPDWRLWQVRLLPWPALGLAGQRQLQQEERGPLLLHDPGALDKWSKWSRYRGRIFLKPIVIVFKAASSHVKRLVGERGEWEVEVERLRFFLLVFFHFFFLIEIEVLLSSTREQHKARSRELRDQCKSLCSMLLITYNRPLLISSLVSINREHRSLEAASLVFGLKTFLTVSHHIVYIYMFKTYVFFVSVKQIEKVFGGCSHQKVSDHFTKVIKMWVVIINDDEQLWSRTKRNCELLHLPSICRPSARKYKGGEKNWQ